MTDATAAASKPKAPRPSPQIASSFELPKFDPTKFELPNMEVPAAFREFAEKSVAQAQDTYEKVKAAAAEATNVLEETCTAAAQGTAEYNRKAVEAASSHADTFFNFALALLNVKSPTEFFKLSSAHLSKQLEAVTEQTKELSALAQKAASETAEPIKTGITSALKKVV
jgi:phasin